MTIDPIEQIIIDALSKPLNHPLVEKCVALLDKYQTVEIPGTDTIKFYTVPLNMALFFDEQDILIKVEILTHSPTPLAILNDLLRQYADKQQIYQRLGEPRVKQPGILAYDLKTYWMRFELEAENTQKIIYLALSTVGKGYLNQDIILRTCKSSKH